MSLEYWKREKNFRALEKGYAREPEGFPFKFLLERLREETDELEQVLINETGFDDMDTANFYTIEQAEEVIKECADISNIVDYIASKAFSFWPDTYHPEEAKA